jgi:Metal-dependent hydrolases of the beta-lactamase superfamily III
MEFSFTTMGTASALPIAFRYPSAHVLNIHGRLFLIDCGEGAQMQLRRYNIPFSKIDNILISHLHGDHLFGLFGLLSTLGMSGRIAPLYLYGPEGLLDVIEFFKAHFAEGVKYEIIFNRVRCSKPILIYESKSIEIYAFPLKHRGETYGYLFKEKQPQLNVIKHIIEPYNLTFKEIATLKNGLDVVRESDSLTKEKIILPAKDFTYYPYTPRSFAYCSDTAPFKKLSKWIQGVDLLYHEATFDDNLADTAVATFHSTATDAAKCAVESGAKQLIIGHYSSRYRDTNIILEQAKKNFQ